MSGQTPPPLAQQRHQKQHGLPLTALGQMACGQGSFAYGRAGGLGQRNPRLGAGSSPKTQTQHLLADLDIPPQEAASQSLAPENQIMGRESNLG